LLNLGHTFAHAFEKLTHYSDALLHGEAVGFGMVLAFALSAARGDCAPAYAERVKTHMQKAGLPIAMAQIGNGNFGVNALIEAMRQDKKMQAGTMRFILARAIGNAFVTDTVTDDELRGFLIAQGAQA
jgi:3-dehydroquinate synthetase